MARVLSNQEWAIKLATQRHERQIKTCNVYAKVCRERKNMKAWAYWMNASKRHHKAILVIRRGDDMV